MQDLDEQIKSMITKSDLSAGPGKGKLATCNVCGKQGPYMVLPRHIEANHITGVSHACDICGKVSRSRNTFPNFTNFKIYSFRTRLGLSVHKSVEHKAIKA